MIVGSVLPVTLRRQAEVKGAHRTAGPDRDEWFFRSDVSEAVRRTTVWITSPAEGEVYHSTVSASHRV
jgi:hypothetical protein